jgi:hypothetical protein
MIMCTRTYIADKNKNLLIRASYASSNIFMTNEIVSANKV